MLCEKPLTFTVKEAEELYALAAERDAVLMEGIKTAYCPGFMQMMNVARSGIIGEVRDVEACFSRITPPALREMKTGSTAEPFWSLEAIRCFPSLSCWDAIMNRWNSTA